MKFIIREEETITAAIRWLNNEVEGQIKNQDRNLLASWNLQKKSNN